MIDYEFSQYTISYTFSIGLHTCAPVVILRSTVPNETISAGVTSRFRTVIDTHRIGTCAEFSTASLVHLTGIPTEEGRAIAWPLMVAVKVKLSIVQITDVHDTPPTVALTEKHRHFSNGSSTTAVIGKYSQGGVGKGCHGLWPSHFQSLSISCTNKLVDTILHMNRKTYVIILL